MVRGNRRKILNGIFLKVGLFLGKFASERANRFLRSRENERGKILFSFDFSGIYKL
jgi:hypothetical protein